MSNLEQLKQAKSIRDLSRLLNFKAASIAYLIYATPPSEKYTTFDVPKKNGGVRTINAPNPKLKKLQKSLSVLLQDCQDELYPVDLQAQKNHNIRSLSHGFRRSRTIFTNASMHIKKNYLFNIDLENFFETFNFGRVRGFFIKDKNFMLDEKVATIIAQIACHDNSLPQGSPSSPIISNLVANFLDVRLFRLAKKNSCIYTRYADDISFSCWGSTFPRKIASPDSQLTGTWHPGSELSRIISRSGFSVNNKKTRMQTKFQRQEVTGLSVNRRVGVVKEYRKNTRSMVDRIIRERKFYVGDDLYDLTSPEEKKAGLNIVSGRLAFIHQSDSFNKDREAFGKSRSRPTNLSRWKTHKNFIYARDFKEADRPVLICEGKTDHIYIDCAQKALGHNYINLVKANKNSPNPIKLYRYTRITKEILELRGGTPDLASFISTYKNNMKVLNGFTPRNPVIILVDNDSGSHNVFKQAASISGISKIDGSKDFYHLYKNLYLVAIPKINGYNTEIEQLFDKKTLSTTLSGKTFNSKVENDTSRYYGKYIFARKVIQKNQKHINFDGFRDTLERLDLAIEDYKSRI